jgi:hypothetical protein
MRGLAVLVLLLYACVPLVPTPGTKTLVIYTLDPRETYDGDVIFEDLREEAWRLAVTRDEWWAYDPEMRCEHGAYGMWLWDGHEGRLDRWKGRVEA